MARPYSTEGSSTAAPLEPASKKLVIPRGELKALLPTMEDLGMRQGDHGESAPPEPFEL